MQRVRAQALRVCMLLLEERVWAVPSAVGSLRLAPEGSASSSCLPGASGSHQPAPRGLGGWVTTLPGLCVGPHPAAGMDGGWGGAGTPTLGIGWAALAMFAGWVWAKTWGSLAWGSPWGELCATVGVFSGWTLLCRGWWPRVGMPAAGERGCQLCASAKTVGMGWAAVWGCWRGPGAVQEPLVGAGGNCWEALVQPVAALGLVGAPQCVQ